MGVLKCRVGFVWSLLLAVCVSLVPRYWELTIDSIPALNPAPPPVPKPEVVEDTIQKNRTLTATLVDYNIPITLANDIAGLIKPVFDLRKIRFGNPFRLEKELDGTLRAFEYKIDDERVLKVEKDADSYAARVEKLEFEVRQATVNTRIATSLWDALDDYPKGETLTTEFAAIFQWDVDFSTEIQSGDQVRFIVDEQYHDGEFIKYGKIRAAQFVNAGRTFRAFLFNDAYYDEKGNAVKRGMLASPLQFTRISSGFARRRMHPILGEVRQHLAVDYAAPVGTPVQAVANGTVVTAGWSGGYGNLVQIRHSSGLTTGYAHLSKISPVLHKGTVVKQGQWIGSVGATGLATGPHLHYMMSRNGTFINPGVVKTEPPVPIAAALKPQYLQQVEAMRLRLNALMARTE
jgi:murein DD-endopeptidase MepM/ murein hydrolase activator NlpD